MSKPKILIFLSSIFILLSSSCTDDNPDPDKPRCGDFMINQFSEECDNADFGSKSCISLGYYGGYLICTDQCQIDTSSCETFGRCGDGILNIFEGEECDTDNSNGKTCENLGYYGGTLQCDSNCKLDLSDCIAAGYCGDSKIQMDEVCDGTAFLSENSSCAKLGYYGGIISCKDDCTLDLKDCEANGICGDGEVQTGAGEECDTNSLNDTNCENNNYWTGELNCTNECKFDFSGCVSMTKLTVGTYHTCAIDSNNETWCWGEGTYGSLGDGIPSPGADLNERYETAPVNVLMPLSVTFEKIDAGSFFTCALDSTGDVWCWGLGGYGELGMGIAPALFSSPNKIQMPVGVKFTDLSVGSHHACAVGDNGKVYCWGLGQLGQLGIYYPADMPSTINTGDATDGSYYSATPQPILEDNIFPNEQFVKVEAGTYHTCAVTAANNLYCWGLDDNCEISEIHQYNCIYFEPYEEHPVPYFKKCNPLPTLVASGTEIQLMALGGGTLGATANNSVVLYAHTCVYAENAVHCRGSNALGQLGNSYLEIDDTPHCDFERVSLPLGVKNIDSLTAGLGHTCISGQEVEWCWGFNYVGQLGNGTNTYVETMPRLVSKPFGKSFHGIEAGLMTTCTLGNGTVWCWGLGIQGQLGIGTTDVLNEPHSIVPPATSPSN